MSMTAFWMKFADRTSACAWVSTEQEARDLAATNGKEVVSLTTLPYPTNPRLDKNEGWGKHQIPSFCYRPESCKGKTACPQRPSCTE